MNTNICFEIKFCKHSQKHLNNEKKKENSILHLYLFGKFHVSVIPQLTAMGSSIFPVELFKSLILSEMAKSQKLLTKKNSWNK